MAKTAHFQPQDNLADIISWLWDQSRAQREVEDKLVFGQQFQLDKVSVQLEKFKPQMAKNDL